MDGKKRAALIRLGNELFNEGDLTKAAAIFEKTVYKDGLTRIGDYFFYDKKQPLYALKYYQLSDRKDKVDEIFDRMVFALGKLMGKEQSQKVDLPPLKVSPKLKILAEEILRDQAAEE
jgi:hypothetical protein